MTNKTDSKKIVKKMNDFVSEKDLVARQVCFSEINFKFNRKDAIRRAETMGVRALAVEECDLAVDVEWKPLAIKTDNRGVVIGTSQTTTP